MWLSPDSEWGQRTKPDYLKMSPRSRTLSRGWFPPLGPCMRMFTPMRVSPSLLIFVFASLDGTELGTGSPWNLTAPAWFPGRSELLPFRLQLLSRVQMRLLFVGRSWRSLHPGRTDSLEVRASRGHGKMLSVDGRWHLQVLLPSDMYRMGPPSWVVSGTISHEAETRSTEDPQLVIFWKKPAFTIHSWSPRSVCGPSLQWVGAAAGLVTTEITVWECRGQRTNGSGRTA